jgi:hypothetical protein
MAGSPEVAVKVNLVPTTKGTSTRNVARGKKAPWYLTAARRRQDRDYVPTDVWDELP